MLKLIKSEGLRRYFTSASRVPGISVTQTPNPKTFVYSVERGTIPRSAMSQLTQHGSVSDVHRITEDSIAVTFFQNQAVLSSVRDDVKSELQTLLSTSQPLTFEIDTTPEPERKTFDPDTPAGRVDLVIAERIRPGVNADGGDVELVEVTDDGVAIIKMMGSCNGCPSSDATLKNAIERTLLHFCADDVKEVRQAPSETETIDSLDVVGAMTTAGIELPSVISHNHVGQPLEVPFNGKDFPVVSLFARQVDQKLTNRVKFASTVTIPKDAKSAIDVWVNCGDCGAKKRLEDVDRLIRDAKDRVPHVDRVAIIICPACAVVVKEV